MKKSQKSILSMHKTELLKIKLKCLEIVKAQAEIRGKEFTKVFVAFVNLFAWLFQNQTKIFLDYIDNNPQLFTGSDGQIIQKSDEFGDMMPGDDFMDEVNSLLVKAHMIGQDGTNKEVTGQVDIMMEVKNLWAELYAKEQAWELMSRVNDTTKQEVRDLFSKAWTENWTVKEIKDAITEQFSQFSQYRASLIATMEVGNAYEVWKKDQFASYQARFGIQWYKRSQTQHDSRVRASHNMNEIDGWIAEGATFSGTHTDHAPHEFNCRCVTLRRLLPPETSDIVATQFDEDKSSYLSEKQKSEITGLVQSFRQKAPIFPKLKTLTDFWDAANGDIAAYIRGKDALTFNSIGWDDIQMNQWWAVAGDFTGIKRKEAIVSHEMGHYIEDYIGRVSVTDETYRGKKWWDIFDSMVQSQISLLSDWQSGKISGTSYPIKALELKWYETGLSELFAESVSAYTMWKTAILNKDMLDFLNFIFWK